MSGPKKPDPFHVESAAELREMSRQRIVKLEARVEELEKALRKCLDLSARARQSFASEPEDFDGGFDALVESEKAARAALSAPTTERKR